MTDWRWPNFTREELQCSHTGWLNDGEEFVALMDDIQAYRTLCGHAIPITSASRSETHPIEAKKSKPGWHTIAAVDVGLTGEQAINFLKHFLDLGYVGIGVHQKGGERFIHVDRRRTPAIWSY